MMYTQEHVDLLIAFAKAETKLIIYNALAQSWDEEFERHMEGKIVKAELQFHLIKEKLTNYETANS